MAGRRGRRVDGFPGGVIRPRTRARIGGCLEPTTRRQDVVAFVAIDVADANAVAVRPIADHMLHPGAAAHFEPGLRRAVLLRDDLERPAVVVDVGEHGELHVAAAVTSDLLPERGPAGLAGVLPPGDLPREPRHVGEVGIAITVDVDRHQAEAVDVVAGEPDVAKLVLRPRWCLVPELTRHDVEPAIAVDISDRGGFAGTGIDRVDLEREIRRAALGPCSAATAMPKGSGGKIACV